MNCPKCFEFNIPDSANFCPSCGRQLRPGKFVVMDITEQTAKEEKTRAPEVPKMVITKCGFIPSKVKPHHATKLTWEGENVLEIILDGITYHNPKTDSIVKLVTRSTVYNVCFIGLDGSKENRVLGVQLED